MKSFKSGQRHRPFLSSFLKWIRVSHPTTEGALEVTLRHPNATTNLCQTRTRNHRLLQAIFQAYKHMGGWGVSGVLLPSCVSNADTPMPIWHSPPHQLTLWICDSRSELVNYLQLEPIIITLYYRMSGDHGFTPPSRPKTEKPPKLSRSSGIEPASRDLLI